MADVEAFLQPITVIPDIGNENKLRYLQVKARNEWAASFTKWLEDPHHLDAMDEEYESEDETDEADNDTDESDEAGDESEEDEDESEDGSV